MRATYTIYVVSDSRDIADKLIGELSILSNFIVKARQQMALRSLRRADVVKEELDMLYFIESASLVKRLDHPAVLEEDVHIEVFEQMKKEKINSFLFKYTVEEKENWVDAEVDTDFKVYFWNDEGELELGEL